VCFGTNFTTPVSVTPASGRHVFATKQTFNPSAGISAADSLCQNEAAKNPNLPNPTRFLAALATTSASVQSRFNMSGATWVRVDGVLVAATPADFMAGTLLAPPSTDEYGNTLNSTIWLGSAKGMTVAAGSGNEDCNDWSSVSSSATGITGAPTWGGLGVTSAFTEWGNSPFACAMTNYSIMCLEN
jgi:hypothetical protein